MLTNLLFVCTGNICRSPMAAAVFSARADRRPGRVASAGVAALVNRPVPEAVKSLMLARGIDISHHRGAQFTSELAQPFDLVLVMEQAHRLFIEQNWIALRGRVRRLGEWRSLDIEDPFNRSDKEYAFCLDAIETCLSDWEVRLAA
jgi:protein-tyrosine phosphatase